MKVFDADMTDLLGGAAWYGKIYEGGWVVLERRHQGDGACHSPSSPRSGPQPVWAARPGHARANVLRRAAMLLEATRAEAEG